SSKNKIKRFFFCKQEIFANTVKKIRDLLSQAPYHPPERGALWQDRCTCGFAQKSGLMNGYLPLRFWLIWPRICRASSPSSSLEKSLRSRSRTSSKTSRWGSRSRRLLVRKAMGGCSDSA